MIAQPPWFRSNRSDHGQGTEAENADDFTTDTLNDQSCHYSAKGLAIMFGSYPGEVRGFHCCQHASRLLPPAQRG
jgi:hypothetical protein